MTNLVFKKISINWYDTCSFLFIKKLLKNEFNRNFLTHTLAQHLLTIHLQLKNKVWMTDRSFTIIDLLLFSH